MTIKHFRPSEYDLKLIIEWPVGYSDMMLAASTMIYDAGSGEAIKSISGLTIYVGDGGLIWAEVEMYADLDGKPLFQGPPLIENNSVVMKVFKAQIAQMLSVQSARAAYTLGHKGEAMQTGVAMAKVTA